MSRMKNAKFFSKIDCTRGFWQLKLDDRSSKLCTFSTHFGRYRYLRLPFGINSAPEIFHRTIASIFENLSNVATYMDDIILWGEDREEHDQVLREVLKRCRSVGLSLKKGKCETGVESLSFMGEVMSQDGIKHDPKKITAIQDSCKIPTRIVQRVQYLEVSHQAEHRICMGT